MHATSVMHVQQLRICDLFCWEGLPSSHCSLVKSHIAFNIILLGVFLHLMSNAQVRRAQVLHQCGVSVELEGKLTDSATFRMISCSCVFFGHLMTGKGDVFQAIR